MSAIVPRCFARSKAVLIATSAMAHRTAMTTQMIMSSTREKPDSCERFLCMRSIILPVRTPENTKAAARDRLPPPDLDTRVELGLDTGRIGNELAGLEDDVAVEVGRLS